MLDIELNKKLLIEYENKTGDVLNSVQTYLETEKVKQLIQEYEETGVKITERYPERGITSW